MPGFRGIERFWPPEPVGMDWGPRGPILPAPQKRTYERAHSMPWHPDESLTLYNVPNWGGGFFGINEDGNVAVDPNADGRVRIDMHDLVNQIKRRGIEAPILLRFDGILRTRARHIQEAFDRAREEYGYPSDYRTVFPIKVNQQRHLVDALLQQGDKQGMGLEVGSKPELLAVMALYSGDDRLIICNGYKDREYIETALLTTRLGSHPIIVIEKYSELETVFEVSEKLGITPRIGVRTKLAGMGSGRWKESGGHRSKFGLTTSQMVQLVGELKERGMLSSLELLHFHLGSQITQIRSIKDALREGLKTLIGLRELGAPIHFFDVGGGLGVDYDGSKTNFESSMNYSLQEYANDVVYTTKEACDEAGMECPTLLSESGRALTAHHAVLITEVMGVSNFSSVESSVEVDDASHEIVHELAEVCAGIHRKNILESHHDVVHLRDTAMTLFNLGQLNLPDRARVEELFWLACQKILHITRDLDYVPEELDHLERELADIYFLNFSVFQSMPDAWAIRQLFPILPLHRHEEKPVRRGVLADITCDSDGRVDRFIDLRDVKRVLELHPLKEGEPYYIGFFLLGAYQEILGDLHNLFGDTNVVHVDAGEDGRPRLTHVVPGDQTQEVLSYVEYFPADLLKSLRAKIERAIDLDQLNLEETATILRRFEAGLASYTYLIQSNGDHS